jgi:hypothetical protein
MLPEVFVLFLDCRQAAADGPADGATHAFFPRAWVLARFSADTGIVVALP